MLEHRQFYINGAWVDPAVANDFDVVNPSNEENCAIISLGGQADTDAAVAAAKAAFESWSQTSKEERLALLEKLLEVYNARQEEMAQAMSMEMGAPQNLAREQQTGAGSWHLDGFIKAFRDFEFDSEYTKTEMTLKEPIGVVACITPWNWPINQLAAKIGPALVAGCTMVLKPSEVSPLSAQLFAEFIEEAGFPTVVFNMVHGTGAMIGDALTSHPDVDMVSFTGSTRAGIQIAKSAAETVKRVSQELGGKSANIVFADSGLEKAVTRGVLHCFGNTGQSCDAPTRMFVPRARHAEALAAAAAPTLPPCPGLLSITMAWPKYSASLGATARAKLSAPPPGGNGTTSLMGLLG